MVGGNFYKIPDAAHVLVHRDDTRSVECKEAFTNVVSGFGVVEVSLESNIGWVIEKGHHESNKGNVSKGGRGGRILVDIKEDRRGGMVGR